MLKCACSLYFYVNVEWYVWDRCIGPFVQLDEMTTLYNYCVYMGYVYSMTLYNCAEYTFNDMKVCSIGFVKKGPGNKWTYIIVKKMDSHGKLHNNVTFTSHTNQCYKI